jgi:acyl carrier protein
VELPGGQGLVITGRLSPATQPWLADHVIAGRVLLPGMVFAELAWYAGTLAGCAAVEELTVLAPLTVPGTGAVQVQVMISAADGDGRQPVTISARSAGGGQEWVRHASGMLVAEASPAAEVPRPGEWPPAGAVPVPVAGGYERLAAAGYEYGPGLRAVTAAWSRGAETFAEISLPEPVSGSGFAVHPVLLDAALHAVALGDGNGLVGEAGQVTVPFVWSQVRLVPGTAGRLRAQLAPAGPDAVSVTITDESGRLAGQIGSVRSRPVTAAQLTAGTGDGGLLGTDWIPVPAGEPAGADWAIAGTDPFGLAVALGGRCTGTWQDLDALIIAVQGGMAVPAVVAVSVTGAPGSPVPRQVDAACRDVLAVLRQWREWDQAGQSVLVVITRGAVAAVGGDDAGDLAGAAVWGLVRSAQSEQPGRLVLADIDHAEASAAALPTLAGTGEPQAAIRGGQLLAARLARLPGTAAPGLSATSAPASGPGAGLAGGRVLVSGGTGRLGGLVAGYLAGRYGVAELVLASRRGPAAPGAAGLAARLVGAGARVRMAACDMGDSAAVRGLAGWAAGQGRLAGVVHLAGTAADAATGVLDDRVLGARAAGAWHLHEATAAMDLAALVMVSSAPGMLGGPGQGSSAAAGAFLDALAAWRQRRGLPALSLAWAVTGHLAEPDLARLRTAGLVPVDPARALDLLDAALAGTSPAVLAARVDTGALAARARTSQLPALLRDLVVGPHRAGRGRAEEPGGLAARLAGLDTAGRHQAVLELIQAQAAVGLGHPTPQAIDPAAPFRDLGFDSPTAVELRNRLAQATSLRLPATLIFDYPTPTALATHLAALLLPSQPARKAIFTDIEQWNEELPSIDLNQSERKEIAMSLRGLLRKLSTTPAEASGGPDDSDDLDSDEALLSALDTESEFLAQSKYA